MSRHVASLALWLSLAAIAPVFPQDNLPTEADYYKITTFQPPDGAVLEVGGFQLMPDGKLARGWLQCELTSLQSDSPAIPSPPSTAAARR